MTIAVVTPPPLVRKPARTRAEELHRQLADEIVRGVLPPGSPLDETDVAQRFGVSRTPVREAIRQLAASGLVETRAHRGAVVALPSPERLVDMFRAMAELEALCAGLAAISMTAIERRALEAMHQELEQLVHRSDSQRYTALNEAFHHAIYASRQDAQAVVHVHSPHATARACLRRPLPAFHYMVAVAGGPDIRCAPYATFGSQALAQAATAALDGRLACLLANHGMITLGRDIGSAIDLAVEVEDLARQYLLALTIGEPVILPAAEMQIVLEKFKTYGAHHGDE